MSRPLTTKKCWAERRSFYDDEWAANESWENSQQTVLRVLYVWYTAWDTLSYRLSQPSAVHGSVEPLLNAQVISAFCCPWVSRTLIEFTGHLSLLLSMGQYNPYWMHRSSQPSAVHGLVEPLLNAQVISAFCHPWVSRTLIEFTGHLSLLSSMGQ